MHLIPLDQTIYFNMTQLNATALATICLLSFTYHPSFSNILYLLYGSTSLAVNGSKYGSLYLLVRDTDIGDFIQNSTVNQSYVCNITCQIKATTILFLIESESLIGIYPLNTTTYQVISSPIMTKHKSNQTPLADIYRLADIYKDKYIIATDSITYFGQVAGTNLTLHSLWVNFYANNILHVGISENEVFGAVNSSNVSLIYYDCVPCIFNGSTTSLSISDFLIIPTGLTVFNAYRIYQGYFLNGAILYNSKVYWGHADGLSYKYLINGTNFQLLQSYNSLIQYKSLANNQNFLLYGTDHNLNRRSFDNYTSSDEYQLQNYRGYYLQNSYQAYMDNAAISNDSSIFAVHSDANSWNIQQYQIVDDCSLYEATIDSISNLYCSCSQYYTNNLCALSAAGPNSTNGTGSFPLPILISVVIGLIGVVITVIVIKKNYKRCTKGRRRTPWKYNPVEIMSFQM